MHHAAVCDADVHALPPRNGLMGLACEGSGCRTHHAAVCDVDVHALPPFYELEQGLSQPDAVDHVQYLSMCPLRGWPKHGCETRVGV